MGKEHKILGNLIGAVVTVLVITIVTQIILGVITHHNQEIDVPDFSGKTVTEAVSFAAKNDVRVEVTDSVFIRRMAAGTVFSQNPAPGKKVKKGRRVMLTINAFNEKTVEMPDLVGYSLRQAKTELMSCGLVVGKLDYRSDIATNNVLDQIHKGRHIRPGTKIATESVIDLIVGLSPDNSLTYVPHVIGYNYNLAKDIILDNSLNVGRVRFDETCRTYQDSLNAVVYSQSPSYSATEPVTMGTSVHINLTTSKAKLSSAK